MASNPIIEAFPTYATAPATPFNGMAYVNTSDHKVYVYYYNSWQVLHELSAIAATDRYASLWFLFGNVHY